MSRTSKTTSPPRFDRRALFRGSAGLAAGLGVHAAAPRSTDATPATAPENGLFIVGPKPGYSPQVGTLVSMLAFMRSTVMRSVHGLSVADLDHLHDPGSNRIGALLLHLAATEVWYQATTFYGRTGSTRRSDGPGPPRWSSGKPVAGASPGEAFGSTSTRWRRYAKSRSSSFASGTTRGSRPSTRGDSAGNPPTTIASGFTYASTSRTTTARSGGSGNASRHGANRGPPPRNLIHRARFRNRARAPSPEPSPHPNQTV